MVKEVRKIGVVHHMNGGNLGDDATLEAVAENIGIRWPDAEIVGLAMVYEDKSRILTWPFSHKAADDEVEAITLGRSVKTRIKSLVVNAPFALKFFKAIHKIVITPKVIVREVAFLAKSFRTLRQLDLLVVSVGGQLAESTGKHWVFRYTPWKFPYTVFKWLLLGKAARVKTIVLNVAASRTGGLSKRFLNGAVFLADSVGFRDGISREQFRLRSLDRKSFVVPDSAYSRDVADLKTTRRGRRGNVVGLAPMIFGDPSRRQEAYLRKIASFASWLVNNDYRVVLFCTNIVVDSPALCGLQAIMREGLDRGTNGPLDRVHQWSAEELLANMSSMDYIVASRFHAVVFAHLLNIPVLAISGHETVRTLMNDLSLGEYCVDVEECDPSILPEKFMSLVSHSDDIDNRMSEKLLAIRREIARQFDDLFPRRASSNVANSVSHPSSAVVQ